MFDLFIIRIKKKTQNQTGIFAFTPLAVNIMLNNDLYSQKKLKFYLLQLSCTVKNKISRK